MKHFKITFSYTEMPVPPISFFIQDVKTDGGGSGNVWDIITLKDGKILCLSDECVTVWNDKAEFEQFMEGNINDADHRTLDVCNLKPVVIKKR